MFSELTEDDAEILQTFKDRIATAQINAEWAVNRELVRLYRQMRALAEDYPDEQFVQQVAAQIAWDIMFAFWITSKSLRICFPAELFGKNTQKQCLHAQN